MALKAKKPKIVEKRMKTLLYSPAGSGKTTAAIKFPNSYIIDTEKGTDFYAETINKAGSVVLQSHDPEEIKEELKELLTTKHKYRTLIIDPISVLYHAVQDKWTRRFEKNSKSQKDADIQDFGMRYWGKVKSDFKSIQRLILALDMNVIMTSHQKDVYGSGFSKVGVTFDSMKGDDYIFDLVFRIEKRGEERWAITEKERAEIGEAKFPAEFIWSYENFLKFYGKEIIEKAATPVKMASENQIKTILDLTDVGVIPEEEITKWFAKANIEGWEEMTDDQISKCIKHAEKKLKTLNAGKEGA